MWSVLKGNPALIVALGGCGWAIGDVLFRVSRMLGQPGSASAFIAVCVMIFCITMVVGALMIQPVIVIGL